MSKPPTFVIPHRDIKDSLEFELRREIDALHAENARQTKALKELDTGIVRAMSMRAIPHHTPEQCMAAMYERLEDALKAARAALGEQP